MTDTRKHFVTTFVLVLSVLHLVPQLTIDGP